MSRTHIPAELRRSVRQRARDCCEYCLIPESMTLAVHEINHVIAEKHGGVTEVGLEKRLTNVQKNTIFVCVIDPSES